MNSQVNNLALHLSNYSGRVLYLNSEVEDPAMNAMRCIFLLLDFNGCGKEENAYYIRGLTIESAES
jgi:hypothetical protein